MAKHGPTGKKQPAAWRQGADLVVTLAGAVLIALLIKAYVFDVYLIPSGSMETALHGRPDGGDRIFCSKLNYRFRQPNRWEVAVFEFPYESARRSDPYNVTEQYRGQNFVKRVVGLPGESLAIGKGDIWVRPNGGQEYTRLVKPDSVQRGMWLNVYEEDFSDLSRDELNIFWNITGNATLDQSGPLVLASDERPAQMNYRVRQPSPPDRRELIELPGIPDRYTLRQPVQFRCNTVRTDGSVCNHTFVKTLQTQNMQARCPQCGTLLDETSAVFYHRRSGLPAVGPNAFTPSKAPQGEVNVQPRQCGYHYVPDLRVVSDITLGSQTTAFVITLREDRRYVEAWFHGDGLVELRINGQPSQSTHRAVSTVKPGSAHKVEFYLVDGTARVFVDSTAQAVLDVPVWNDKRSFPRNQVQTSGIGLAVTGGQTTIRNILIDRDVFYYSGWEQEYGDKFARMNSQGETFIDENSFLPLGDHGPSSYDARSWGPVPLGQLRGPALFIWWPPERIGKIPSP